MVRLAIRRRTVWHSFNKLKPKNVNKLVIGHLNVNSETGKLDPLKVVIESNIDILIVTETKDNSSFSTSQFVIKGFSMLSKLTKISAVED